MPGYDLPMNTVKFMQGDPVRITSGIYKDAEGVIEDLQPECSAVRVHTKSGLAYSFLETMSKIVKPMPMLSPGKPLLK